MNWEAEYQAARTALHNEAGPQGSSGMPLSLRRGIETRYTVAHEQLVKQGKHQQLKRKYRR